MYKKKKLSIFFWNLQYKNLSIIDQSKQFIIISINTETKIYALYHTQISRTEFQNISGKIKKYVYVFIYTAYVGLF